VPTRQPVKSPRRSLLFVPGDSRRKISKIIDLSADAIILDLEDAVALSEKESARHLVCHTLVTTDFGGRERLVRVNSPATSFFGADLTAVASARPDGLVIPKAESAAELVRIDEALTDIELAHDWPAGAIRLLALIETALGIMNLKEIAQSTSRLDALLFGAEDLAADMGAVRTQPGWEVFYGRSAVATAAAAYGLQAIDCVYAQVHNVEGLEEDAAFGRNMGYSGKMAVHPGQVAAIDGVFSPSPAAIAAAQLLLQKAAENQDHGAGVFVVDGRMVDAPLILAAERLLERARLCGLVDG
jgi:citrate lyase beta subunit